jgi:type I restriction enzyme S subunit
MAQALFKSWFVDFDPVIDNALAAGNPIPDELAPRAEVRRQALANGTANRETAKDFPDAFQFTEELGWIPEGWEVGCISDLAALNSESWTAKKHPESVNYVDLANTKDGRINETTSYEFGEAPSRARRVLKQHDTIIGTVRPGNRSFAYIHEDGLTGSTGFAVFRPNEVAYRSFIYLGLTRDEVIEVFAHLADGAAYPAIRPEVVGNTHITVPSSEVLQLFEDQSALLIAKVGQHQREADTLTKLRDTLLPKLISGEIITNEKLPSIAPNSQ